MAQITVTSLTQFTYAIVGTPATPATGSPFEAIPVITVNNITIVSGVATFTTLFANTLIDQQRIQLLNITGFASFDGNHTATVIDDTTFTVTTGEGDQSSLAVTGTLRSIHANVNVQSDDTGTLTITGSNSLFDYQGVIADVDTVGKSIEGMQGGAEVESDDDLRARVLLSRSAQEGIFTNDQITLAALAINGNTRVFIQNPDSDQLSDPDPVLPGQVRVYFLRDNDPLGPIPTGSVINLTKQSIILNGRLPAEMWSDDLQVIPPEELSIDIYLYDVKPSTASMRSAIRNQYEAYFEDADVFGKDLDDDVLRGVTILAKDLTAGNPEEAFVKSFDFGGITSSLTALFATTVSDSGGFVQFDTVSAPAIGEQVIVYGFTTNPGYNVSGLVTASSGSGFQVGLINFVAIESGEFTAPSNVVGKNQLPKLGKLTINGIEV